MTALRSRVAHVCESPLAPLALIGVGAALRLDVFLRDYSLTINEATIARNVLEQSWADIFVGRDSRQAASVGFLLLEKGAATIFGAGERALRLVPLLSSLVSLVLFWSVARRALSRPAALCALSLLVLGVSFVDYAAQAQAYSTDVAMALWIALLALALRQPVVDVRRATWLGIAGVATVFFSLSTTLVLAAVAATTVMLALGADKRETRTPRLVAAMLWGAGAAMGAIVALARQTPEGAAYVQRFWQRSFMPMPPDSLGDLLWLWPRLKNMFGYTGGYRATVLWIALLVLGAWSFRRRKRTDLALVLLSPFLVVIAASAAGRFPLASGRIQLFYLPLVLIVVAEGADWFRSVLPRRYAHAGAAALALLVTLAIHGAWQGSLERGTEDMKALMQFVERHRQPQEPVYVYYGAVPAFVYYAPRYAVAGRDYTLGSCARDSARTYLREIDTFRGRALWVLLVHASRDEQELILRYLDAAGVRLRSTIATKPGIPDGSTANGYAYLYDLRRESAHDDVSAERYAIPAALDGDAPSWSCYMNRFYKRSPHRPTSHESL